MTRRLYVLYVLMMLACHVVQAQKPMFRHLDTKDGLPHSQVNVIHRDARGMMWFGTASGLARYDGYTFRTFRNDIADDASIPGNYVECMTEDGEGRLWVGTEGEQYSIYDPRTETFDRDMATWMRDRGMEGVPRKVFVDRDKTLWLYVAERGLYRLTGGSTKGDGPLRIEHGSLPGNYLSDIGECGDDLLLVYDNGTVVFVSKKNMTVRRRHTKITDDIGSGVYDKFYVYCDGDDDLWFYGTLGIWVYSTGQQRWLTQLCSRPDNKGDMVAAVTEDRQGRIWTGTNKGGIVIIDKATATRRRLATHTVNALFTDDDGTVWVGTYKKGVAYYNESIYKFRLHGTGDINCIEEERPGLLWLGTDDGSIISYDLHTGVTVTYRHGDGSPDADAVTAMHRARDGRLWIGTFCGGLDCYDGRSFRHYRARSDKTGFPADDNVWAIDEDGKGRLWIATLGGGVQSFDPQTSECRTYDMSTSALVTNHIASLCVTRDDRIVIGTASCGVVLLDPETDRMTAVDSLSCLSINHVYEDSRRLIWIGTRNGLNVYDPRTGKTRTVTLGSGTGQFISAITEDDDHGLWVTTSNGVVNITVTAAAADYTYTLHGYGHADGLQDGGFNQRSIKRLSTGEIVMGGYDGINIVTPDNMRYNHTLPHVVFTGFRLFDEEVSVGREYDGRVLLPVAIGYVDKVRLKYSQNMFTVSFATDNYLQPKKTRFVYKLEGFNDEYMTTDEGAHSVTYTNLAPGTYRLKVRAINNDGYEGDEEACLTIVITPPWYMTPWAFILYIVIAAGLLAAVIFAIRYRERNRYRLRQAEEEARKTDELNQMKFRFFTNVSHELRTPLTLIITPLEEMMKTADAAQQATLELIHRNALKLLHLVNQLLDFRKNEMAALQLTLSEGDIVSFVQNICNSFLILSERKNVNLTFYSAEPSLGMAFDSDKMGKMIMNLLSNAFKFTPDGGRVDVAVQRADNNVVIRVSDTGIGIEDEYKERVFDRFFRISETKRDAGDASEKTPSPSTGSGIGLSLVKEYAELHGGSVCVLDNVETGSVFVVTIPIRQTETADDGDNADGSKELSTLNSQLSTPNSQLPLALFVDDNADLVAFMRDSLSLFFRVETAADGREAWKRIPVLMPDIVVTDLMMPGMDGSELCRTVKGDPRTKDIPVMVLTAKQRMEDQAEGLRTGADDYVTKPFNTEVLVLRMRKLVDARRKNMRISRIDPEPSEIVITSLDEKLVASAIKYVEDNISRTDLSVEELARAMGMSRVHLYKQLLRITGKSPIGFIRIIRLKRAAQMLRESQLNVSEIAYQVGFNNPKYFTKYFREEFGMLPSAYQEQNGV